MKKKSLLWINVLLLMSGMLCSCDKDDEEVDLGEAKAVNMLSDVQPIQLTEAQRVFVNDNNQFTLNFLKTVNETDRSGKSFIYSPLSITYVLGMVNDAAVGETERELEQTLGFHEGGIQAVNDYCKNLIDHLPKVDPKVTLNIANALFVNRNKATLKIPYQQDMTQYYDAKAENLDFYSSATLDIINGWCNDHTNGMIPKILDEVDPEVVTYLLNAIYFKADWASKFEEKNTRNETFTTENGGATLPLMHQKVLIKYVKNDTYSAVEIPYGNGMWSMDVLLPEEGRTTDDIIGYLAHVASPVDKARPYEVDLKLPRFETSSDTDEVEGSLIGLMQKMGIRLAFNGTMAEIPNMCERPVYISMMRQKAKIKMNEEGSEAAAVTVAAANYGSASPEPQVYPKATFHANRAFVYVIREASSGVILFVGKFTGR